MKGKINKYISSFDSIVYVLSHATKMQLFWLQLRANDVLPRVLIFNYLKYNNNYYYEIIQDIQLYGWYYIMTRGPMQICHVAFKYIYIRLVGT